MKLVCYSDSDGDDEGFTRNCTSYMDFKDVGMSFRKAKNVSVSLSDTYNQDRGIFKTSQ